MKRIYLLLFSLIFFQQITAQPLSGIYTIGGASPSYTNFTSAVAALQTYGISGPVVFNVRNGTYTEFIDLNRVNGSSSVNTITFQSEAGDSSLVILTYGGSEITFQTDSVEYLTLRKFTIKHTGSSSTYNACGFYFGSNLTVQNCVVQTGGMGDGITALRVDSAITISNCRIFSCNNGIFISDNNYPPYTDNIRIEGCNISIVATTIYFFYVGNSVITHNTLNGSNFTILIHDSNLGEISYNTIKSTGAWVIQVLGSSALPGTLAKIFNNIITVTNATAASAYGASFEQSNRFEFVNNTIYFNSNYNYQSAFYINNVDSCFLYNNIIRNNGNGYTLSIGAIYNFHSDHNDFSWNTGAMTVSGITSLSQFQSTYNTDQNSSSANPQFVSPPNNVHPSNPVVDGLGTPWPNVPDDIVGAIRHPQYPDPGAYEFSFAPTANLGPDISACAINPVLNAGNNGSYYLWSTGATTQSITATASGSYWVRITNSAGISSDTINVTIHPLPTVSVNGNSSLCQQDTVQLTVSSSASTYNWLPTTGLDNPAAAAVNASPASSITYTVTVMDNFGCTNDDSIALTVHPLPVAQAGSDQSICIGTQVQIGSASGSNCNWSPATNLSSQTDCQPFANPVSNTNYILTVTDAFGCQNSDTVLVTVLQLPNLSVCCPQTICTGDTASISAIASNVSFAWAPASSLSSSTGSSVNAFPVSTTTYTVTATDGSGCQSSDSVLITVNPLPTIAVCCDQTLCFGDTVSVSANSSATNFSWSPAVGLNTTVGSTVNAYPTSSTIYIVTVTDGNGCMNSDSVSLTVNPAPATPTITQNGPDLTSSAASGNQWYLNGSPIAGATAQTYTPMANGNYTVTYTDPNGCVAVSAVYFFGSMGIGSNSLPTQFYYTSGELHFNTPVNSEYGLTVYNQLGEIVTNISLQKNTSVYPLHLSAGIFYVVLTNSEKQIGSRIYSSGN